MKIKHPAYEDTSGENYSVINNKFYFWNKLSMRWVESSNEPGRNERELQKAMSEGRLYMVKLRGVIGNDIITTKAEKWKMVKVSVKLEGHIPGTEVPVPSREVTREMESLNDAIEFVHDLVDNGFSVSSINIENKK